MRPIRLPPIYCPLPHSRHPHTDLLLPCCLEWLERWGLFIDDRHRQRLAVSGIGELCGTIYPQGTDELVQVATDYMMWTFAYDDEVCDEGPESHDSRALIDTTSRIQRSLESVELPMDEQDRYGMALRDIRLRLQAHGLSCHATRFATVMRTYFMAEMWKSVSLQPSLNDYIIQRLFGGGGMTFPPFCYMVARIDISEDELASRPVVALTEMAATFATWDNDLFSFPREMFLGRDQRGHNLVDIIRRSQGCSVEDAIVSAVRMRDRVQGLFMRLQEQLMTHGTPAISAYAERLSDYISGVLKWHLNNPRYVFLNGLDGDICVEGAELADRPLDESTEPLPIASIAWWWHHDPARSRRVTLAAGRGR
ncbi:terpene synthase [Pseudomonas fuscovaginae UPB0736]|uniref:terpene synthase family protein n=1 Tax=Pseudomonas asplenii TaxID=53407 RepID=UPI000494B701|nr:terpene synthase metal-binding domain-containing protein [Pseudomonas fuscovaginae]UUQ65916.1 terpene synthase [Pseudomonas fuscovaginae UPB0736]